MTNADEKKKKMKSRKCGKFILTCVVLLGWLSVLSGISAGKYDELGNESGKYVLHFLLLLLLLLLFQLNTHLLQSKPPPTFQTVSNDEGKYTLFFSIRIYFIRISRLKFAKF